MRYYIVAGEASGDLHGSNLVKGLLAEDPQARVRCWGGEMMRSAGAELVHDYKDGAVMGLADTIAKAGKLLGNLSACKSDIYVWHPDVLILIDYPGFNMRLAAWAHKHGIRVFYYIAPKTWASRSGRNKALKRYVDSLFIVFPFEKSYFDSVGVPYVYAGNPLLDAVDGHEFSPVCEGDYVALLPGSRSGEISRMMPVCMQVADRLGCKIVVAGAPSRSESDYAEYIAGRSNVKLVFDRTYDVLKGARAAIINSGTASLEAALIGVPQVVCWSTSSFNAWVARRVLHVLDNVKFISLANLILDRKVFTELIQEEFTADNVCSEVNSLLNDDARRTAMCEDYALVREALGGSGASRAVAREMINKIKHQ